MCQETQKIKTIKNSGEQKNHHNKNKPTIVEWGVVSIYNDTCEVMCVISRLVTLIGCDYTLSTCIRNVHNKSLKQEIQLYIES